MTVASPVADADCQAVVDTATRFAREVINPQLAAWEAAGEVPRSAHRAAAEIGLLGLGYPEQLGGTPAPLGWRQAMTQTLARETGSGGVLAALFSHGIGLPPILNHGSEALQREVVPGVLAGERIGALAITEPSGGSDVANLKTRARLEGDEWVVDGEKTFITSGMRADWITVAVRTGEPGTRGAAGISMLLVPGDSAGLTRTRLDKMGWHCSDTAHLHFAGVRVPRRYLIGEEGAGFRIIMTNFNAERLSMSAMAIGFAEACLADALEWAQQRAAFGAPLIAQQVVRHKLADMQMRIRAAQAWHDGLVQRADAGEQSSAWVGEVCLLKNFTTQTMQFCADEAVQTLGGMGFMRGTRVERIYREVKVMMIGGGAQEVMKELAVKQLGWV